jgi:hypothetical protein
MESGLYVQVFSSVEVIVACLFLIFLLPLVFFIASTKSRRRFVRVSAKTRGTKPVRRPKPAPPGDASEDDDSGGPPVPRDRARGRVSDLDDSG